MAVEAPNPPHAGRKPRDREFVIDIECYPSANGSTILKPGNSDEKGARKGMGCNVTSCDATKGYKKVFPFDSYLDNVVMPLANGGLQSALSSVTRDDSGKNSKKHSKPPRPPKSFSIDAADQKLVQEITELALLKRARIQRMKALKKMKNAKTSSSNNNIWAFFITSLFCLIIIWQGYFSSGNSLATYEGSPSSSMENKDGLFTIQYYKIIPKKKSEDLSSVFPTSQTGHPENTPRVN